MKLKAAFGKQWKQHTNIGGLKAHITKLFQDRVNFPYLPKQDPPVDPHTFEEVDELLQRNIKTISSMKVVVGEHGTEEPRDEG